MISNRSTAQLKIRPSLIARSGEQIWRRRVLWSALLVTFTISFITLAAAAKLEAPFRSDQSLFLLYARMLSRGFKLYVDIWDIKQPAIYWFYMASAEIFSYTERGIHLGEFVWSAAFSICLILTLRNYFAHWAVVALAPLVVVGNYFLQVGATEQTQVEGLIGFPLYLCAYFCCRATEGNHRNRDALLFGMFAALVCLFKMIFIVIIGSFVLVALYLYPKARPPLDKRAFLIYSASGFFAVWAAVATVLIVRQEFWGFYQVTFVYPFAALSEFPPGRPVDLLKGIGFIAGIFAPWACFLVIAAWWGVRRDGAIMTRILLAWVIAGVVITLAQRFSWWIYHFLIFLVPLGILALRGVDVLSPSWIATAGRRHFQRRRLLLCWWHRRSEQCWLSWGAIFPSPCGSSIGAHFEPTSFGKLTVKTTLRPSPVLRSYRSCAATKASIAWLILIIICFSIAFNMASIPEETGFILLLGKRPSNLHCYRQDRPTTCSSSRNTWRRHRPLHNSCLRSATNMP
jgi:Dolichyl-phosphate-mannose-protein mannosyltransferase